MAPGTTIQSNNTRRRARARGGQVANGTIKKLVGDRGFGFIQTEDGSDIFFHRSHVEGDAFDNLREGQSVTHEKGLDPRRGKPHAENITAASVLDARHLNA